MCPDEVTEDEAEALKDAERLIEQYHDPQRYAMLRIGLAPCSPFTVTNDLMVQAAKTARKYSKVRLHTHLVENQEDVDYLKAQYNRTTKEYIRYAPCRCHTGYVAREICSLVYAVGHAFVCGDLQQLFATHFIGLHVLTQSLRSSDCVGWKMWAFDAGTLNGIRRTFGLHIVSNSHQRTCKFLRRTKSVSHTALRLTFAWHQVLALFIDGTEGPL